MKSIASPANMSTAGSASRGINTNQTSNKVKRLFGRGIRRPRWPNEAENYIAVGFDEVETPTE